MKGYADEFPLLPAHGLYAAEILGDGNCLFNALSDQLYGNQNKHHIIRAQVIDHMRENAGYYKQFIEVNAGGGTRRNPKRKTTGNYSTINIASTPTPEEIDNVFDSHLLRMAQGGTYGDNMEIVAFSSAFGVSVKIYQRDYAFMVSSTGEESSKGVCHIAYHTWEHYSSIRNLDGPHDGLPHVQPKEITSEEEDQQQKEKLKHALKVPSWQIQLVAASLPYIVDHHTIEQRIQDYKGDANKAINSFFEADEVRSFSSTQESSVERDVESGGEESSTAPNKKQDRRLSRGAKFNHRQQEERKRRGIFLTLHQDSKSLESLLNATSSSSGTSDQKPSSLQEADTDEEDWTPGPLKDGDTSSGSDYSSIPITKIKLRLPNPSSVPSSVVKSSPPKKKMVSARVMKDLKKQAQKTAAKERRQAAAGAKTSQSSAISTTTPVMTSGIRTLYI